MQSIYRYRSPLGEITLAADEIGLCGAWFSGQKYFPRQLDAMIERNAPIFTEAEDWFDDYFSGRRPDHILPLHLCGTPFQQAIWAILTTIPYGETMTYGEIARRYADEHGLARMSAQAVGGAVGHNPISIIVPCHRVVGTKGSLIGYAGGIERKRALLSLERRATNIHREKETAP